MKRGFTIIEALIVCAILGIVAAIVIPLWMKHNAAAEATTTLEPGTFVTKVNGTDSIETHDFPGVQTPTMYIWHDKPRSMTCYIAHIPGHSVALECVPDAYTKAPAQ